MSPRLRLGLAALPILLLGAALLAWPVTGRTLAARAESAGLAPRTDRAAAAEARVRPALERDLAAAGLRWGAPVFIRIFKDESELELWVDDGQRFRLFRTWPICTWSGDLGPKLRQGDGQSPEGFYRVARGQLNPHSQYHLSFNLGYPNAYDRAHGRTGDYLMVHGSCVSIGCYAMGDGNIEQIYSLLAAALANGQAAAPVHVFPFRFGQRAEVGWRASPWRDFWLNLREGHDAFERTGRPPRIGVAGKRYVVTQMPTPQPEG
jgi:murein L,D-transpeptidase YafK